jgi:hypothetical protein
MSSTRFRRIKRLGAALTAGALGVGFLPVAALTSTASAATVPPPVDTSTWCANVPADNPFTDVDPGTAENPNPHFDNILCMAFADITHGTTATTYSPLENVRRDQMAAFIARFLDVAKSLETTPDSLQALPAATTPSFSDVAGDTHIDDISRLEQAGIVEGLSDEQCADKGIPSPCYGPGRRHSRADGIVHQPCRGIPDGRAAHVDGELLHR